MRAIDWWNAAGRAAIGRAAFAEAEAHVVSALARLPAIEDIARRRREEAGIVITRAKLSIVRYGYGHDLTETLYARAGALAGYRRSKSVHPGEVRKLAPPSCPR